MENNDLPTRIVREFRLYSLFESFSDKRTWRSSGYHLYPDYALCCAISPPQWATDEQISAALHALRIGIHIGFGDHNVREISQMIADKMIKGNKTESYKQMSFSRMIKFINSIKNHKLQLNDEDRSLFDWSIRLAKKYECSGINPTSLIRFMLDSSGREYFGCIPVLEGRV